MIVNKQYLSTLDKLEETLTLETVFVTGCFNLFHPGHAYFLDTAKRFGKTLIIAIAHDDITKVKRLPVLTQDQRMYMVDSHRAVDYVVPEDNKMPPDNVSDIVNILNPSYWITNADNPNLEAYYALIIGTKTEMKILERRTDGIFNISTTSLINKIREGYKPYDVSQEHESRETGRCIK